MTKEEAIARIKDHIDVHHIREDRAIKIAQALNMAIEALERTEWYYPSKGEYPKDGEWVLVVAKNASVVPIPGKWVMQYFAKSDNYLRSDNYFANKTYSIYAPSVACWQYIVPPKEEG